MTNRGVLDRHDLGTILDAIEPLIRADERARLTEPHAKQTDDDSLAAIEARAHCIYATEPMWRVYRDVDVLMLMLAAKP